MSKQDNDFVKKLNEIENKLMTTNSSTPFRRQTATSHQMLSPQQIILQTFLQQVFNLYFLIFIKLISEN
jgi:hypothetical protein